MATATEPIISSVNLPENPVVSPPFEKSENSSVVIPNKPETSNPETALVGIAGGMPEKLTGETEETQVAETEVKEKPEPDVDKPVIETEEKTQEEIFLKLVQKDKETIIASRFGSSPTEEQKAKIERIFANANLNDLVKFHNILDKRYRGGMDIKEDRRVEDLLGRVAKQLPKKLGIPPEQSLGEIAAKQLSVLAASSRELGVFSKEFPKNPILSIILKILALVGVYFVMDLSKQVVPPELKGGFR